MASQNKQNTKVTELQSIILYAKNLETVFQQKSKSEKEIIVKILVEYELNLAKKDMDKVEQLCGKLFKCLRPNWYEEAIKKLTQSWMIIMFSPSFIIKLGNENNLKGTVTMTFNDKGQIFATVKDKKMEIKCENKREQKRMETGAKVLVIIKIYFATCPLSELKEFVEA